MEQSNEQKLGTFIISIDFEYAWGYADQDISDEQKELILDEVEISNSLIDLFDKFNIQATWAIVGHLLEKDCNFNSGRPHANFPEKNYSNRDLDCFAHHPGAGVYDDQLWFDVAGVIKKVKESMVKHEIGSHSYSHILYGDEFVKPEAIKTDIKEAKKIHELNGLEFKSFIFPRNSEGFHDELKEAGIECYRGQSEFWYMKLPGPLGRLFRGLDYFSPLVKTIRPKRDDNGLINIPDSLLLIGRNGLRRFLPPAVTKWKIRRGVNRAVRRGEIFHLWFHPSNFSYETETQLAIFEDCLTYVDKLRKEGKLQVSTMGSVARRY